ncbi:unnamed protein product [marine sediment metagenome]|uniref:Uncharacterized protein n=1 Tax=marine sediment metagenome TaxID=412755 RepID=X0V614_9ZZZZ
MEKKYWRLEDVELNVLEAIIFKSMLSISTGLKTIEELKDLGNVKVNRKGGFTVEFDVSNDKRASLLFGRKYDKYEYRCAAFFKNPEESLK